MEAALRPRARAQAEGETGLAPTALESAAESLELGPRLGIDAMLMTRPTVQRDNHLRPLTQSDVRSEERFVVANYEAIAEDSRSHS